MVELLAPAGEYNSLVGAFSAGADAVYLAGNMYGARASAVNFTTEEIIKAINYAHLLNKKVYLTVNTLVKEEELANLYDFLKPLYLSGLDAVLVQDAGVFDFIKASFPCLDIHMSTQAVVTSVEGAMYHKNRGASRVVLARELTLDEIKDITKLGIETECFVHGAMCYGYSGMCLFSSFLGGNSGNRGRCKGPCRQPYNLNSKDEYLLSLKDMNTVSIMDRLIDAGIYSFKIEGRLKSPSYAAGVTSVYRKVIDYCLEHPGEKPIIEKNDLELLDKLYSRSGSKTGYYDCTSSDKMITLNGGAYNRVSEEEEKQIFDKFVSNPLKKGIEVEFNAYPGTKASLKLSCYINQSVYTSYVESEDELQFPKNSPATEEDILKNLNKLGNTDFSIEKYSINTTECFVPASLVNNMRREAIDKLSTSINDNISYRMDDSVDGYAITKVDFEHKDNNFYLTVFVDNRVQFEEIVKFNNIDKLVLSDSLAIDLYNSDSFKGDNLYVELPAVLRKQNRDYILKLANIVNTNDCFRGIYVSQYDQYELLKSTGYKKQICGNTYIYSYNTWAAKCNEELFDSLMAPLELDLKNINIIGYTDFEIQLYGRSPLMQTANCILKTKHLCTKYSEKEANSYISIEDRIKTDFPVRIRCSDDLCMNTIYNSTPNSLHKYYEQLKNKGYKRYYLRFTNEPSDELHKILAYYIKLMDGFSDNLDFNYTNGHIKGGIL